MTNVKPKTCIIPIAGSGSRMQPITLEAPKHNTPLGSSETILLTAIREAYNAGMEKVVLVTNPRELDNADGTKTKVDESDPIILDALTTIVINATTKKFANDPVMQSAQEMLIKLSGLGHDGLDDVESYKDIHKIAGLPNTAPEKDVRAAIRAKLAEAIVCVPQLSPEGLGHAVYQAKQEVAKGEPFAVILPDDVMSNGRGDNVLRQMVADYQVGNSVAALDVKTKEAAKSYGCFTLKEGVEITEGQKTYPAATIVEKPQNPPSTLAVMGRYVLDYTVMEKLETAVEANERGAGNEIQLTDAYVASSAEDGLPLNAYKYDGKRRDAGRGTDYGENFVKTNLEQKLQNNKRLAPETRALMEAAIAMDDKLIAKEEATKKLDQAWVKRMGDTDTTIVITR